MGILDSIKNVFGGAKPEPDVTVSPSQLLREAGIDSSGLKFGFGSDGSITVSGDIPAGAEREKIVELLSSAPGIASVVDNMSVAAPEPAPAEAPAAEAPAAAEPAEAEPAGAEQPEETAAPEEEGRTYTVQSGDTLWKIAEQMYGSGTPYMKIFEANSDLLDNPDRIFPGQKLVIPDLDD